MSTIQAAVTLIGLLLGGGGIAAVVQLIRQRGREPIERDSLAVELAEKALGVAKGTIEDLQVTQQAQAERMAELERRSQRQDEESAHLRSCVRALTDWARWVVDHWSELRQSETPPDLPSKLRH